MPRHALPALDSRALSPLALAGLALVACSAPSTNVEPKTSAPIPVVRRPAAVAEESESASTAASEAAETGFYEPDVLLPDEESSDAVIARIGDVEVRQSHAYQRLVDREPQGARRLVEQLELDALVALFARRHAIAVDTSRVRALVQQDEDKLRAQVQGSGVSYERALQAQFGMSPERFRRWRELIISRHLFREYVIRYSAMRRDQVEVRYIVHSDRKVLEDIEQRVRQGASFATLAIKHSQDPNRIEGGLLPPFGRGFDHPIAKDALELDEGQLSEIMQRRSQGSQRFYLVFCLRRIPGRDVAFEDVREEIEAGIEQRPLSQQEQDSARMSLLAEMESLKNEPGVR